MIKIIICLFLFICSGICLADDNLKPSLSLIMKGCRNGTDNVCKSINSAKDAIGSATKDVPSMIVTPSITAYYLFVDKGLRLKNTVSDSDFLLIQPKKITVGINFPF